MNGTNVLSGGNAGSFDRPVAARPCATRLSASGKRCGQYQHRRQHVEIVVVPFARRPRNDELQTTSDPPLTPGLKARDGQITLSHYRSAASHGFGKQSPIGGKHDVSADLVPFVVRTNRFHPAIKIELDIGY